MNSMREQSHKPNSLSPGEEVASLDCNKKGWTSNTNQRKQNCLMALIRQADDRGMEFSTIEQNLCEAELRIVRMAAQRSICTLL
jgi:hypothetical protein